MSSLSAGSPSGSTRPSGASNWLKSYRWALIGLVIAAAMVIILAPAASEDPDGLDRVSQDKEFEDAGKDAPYEILPDYSIPGVDNEWVSVVVSGLIGVVVVLVLVLAIGFALRAMGRRPSAGSASRAR